MYSCKFLQNNNHHFNFCQKIMSFSQSNKVEKSKFAHSQAEKLKILLLVLYRNQSLFINFVNSVKIDFSLKRLCMKT